MRCYNCGWGEVDNNCDGSEMCSACEAVMDAAQTEERSGEEVEA